MTGPAFLVYKEIDPAKKDFNWANDSITIMRRDWRSLINVNRARTNKQILLSMYDMSKVKASFKDKAFLECTDILPLGIWDYILNLLTEETTKNPPQAQINATDPASVALRQKDLNLLKTRKIIANDINQQRSKIGDGQVPYQLPQDAYNGNIDEFDKMGLDENDPDDINFYETGFQKLNFEVAGQSVINNIMKLNRFDEDTIADFVIDILSTKVVCMQVYVDQTTGEIKYNYIYPETAYGIFGDASDGKNDVCKGWQDNKTVMEWLSMAGNDFDFNRDWRQILWAINYANGYKYTGFIRNNYGPGNYYGATGINTGGAQTQVFDCCGNEAWMNEMGLGGVQSNLLDWNLAYTYKIYVGYIEWPTAEATETYLKKKTDPNAYSSVPFSYQAKKKEIKEYEKESWYQQQWYCSYFLATSAMTQWVYGFKKIYHQLLYGANDTYAQGTLMYYRKKGRSAVEISIPYIELANFAYYKMLWCVFHAKPEDEQVVVEELVQMSKSLQKMYPQSDMNKAMPSFQNIISQIIQYQRENFIKLRTFPELDGKKVQQIPQLVPNRNGVDPIAQQLLQISAWAEQQIAAKVGLNDLRLAQVENDRQPYKSQVAETQFSMSSTGYVYRMIQFLKEHIATTTVLYAQDIVKFKDTLPYNWLKTIVGEEDFKNLSLLDDFAAHRMGIFVRDLNWMLQRQKINQIAEQALLTPNPQQQITWNQYAVIIGTEDYKKAMKILDFLQNKKEKKLRKQAIQDQQIADNMQANQHERKMEEINAEGGWAYKREQERTRGYVLAAQINSQSRVTTKQIQVDAEPEKQALKAMSEKEVEQNKANIEQQKAIPAGAGAV